LSETPVKPLGVSLRLAQESRQAFSDHVVQAAVLFEHGCPIAPRDFVNVHGNLDYRPIQCAERVEEFVEVGGSDAVGTQFSHRLVIWLGHRISSPN
jgi:hypothetical protein